jgi:putative tricarboxylic transport membrane protein
MIDAWISRCVPRAQTVFGAIALVIAVCAATHAGAQTAWKPDRTVEVVVFAAPGGGNDKSARMMHKIWQETKLLDAVITNKVGGGGSLAYTYVSQKAGDAHHIAIAQAGLVTNHITGRSPLHYNDLTPLSFVGSEPVALAVRADSPYKTLKDFVEQLRKDPASLSISVGSTRGAINHFTVARLAKAAGIDPRQLKILVFGGGAESVTNLLGGHIDAMVQAVNNAIPHHKAGKMRILGLSTPRRSPGIPDAPTIREQGYDVVMEGWTIFVGPKGMSPAQVAYWENIFQKTVQHDHWKSYLESNAWEWGYRNAQETLAYLNKDYEQSRALLVELGMAK